MDGIIADLGTTHYSEVLELQRELNALRNEGKVPDILIFNEHTPVYTVGIHRNPEEILESSIKPIQVERGGSITYHGPGQIVVYFILNLMERRANIKEIILSVQSAIVKLLGDLGITAEGRLAKETGVWCGERKICSIGFAIRGSSTFHGIALNITTDLDEFDRIRPCGFSSSIMTSISAVKRENIGFDEIKLSLMTYLEKELGIRVIKKIGSIEELKHLL